MNRAKSCRIKNGGLNRPVVGAALRACLKKPVGVACAMEGIIVYNIYDYVSDEVGVCRYANFLVSKLGFFLQH